MSRSPLRWSVGLAVALCASGGSGCAVISTTALLPAFARTVPPKQVDTSNNEAASPTADWAGLFAVGEFRRVRDWSPLANCQQAARSGWTWPAHRWDWDVPRERKAEWDAAVRALEERLREAEWTDLADARVRLPEPARTRFAVWRARQAPEWSRSDVPLDSLFATNEPVLKKVLRAVRAEDAESPATLPLATRQAAVWAWCDQLRFRVTAETAPDDATARAHLELDLAPAGALLANPATPLDLREELLLALARDISPDRLPDWSEWVRSPSDEQATPDDIRRNRAACEAALAYVVSHSDHDREATEFATWRETLAAISPPTNTLARQARAAALALVGDDRVLEELTSGLRAGDWKSREHAALCLGLFPGDAARNELDKGRASSDEALTELSLRGLACRDDFEPRTWRVSPPRVREALAAILQTHPQAESVEVLSDLLTDERPTIQARAVETLRAWPDELAWEPTLAGLTRGTFATRQDLHADLERRLDRTVGFPLSGDARARSERVAELARELPASSSVRVAPLEANAGESARRDELRQALITTGESDLLHTLTARDLPLLEEFLATANDTERARLWDEWLPQASPAYAALAGLRSADVVARRQAADRLVAAAHGRTLPEPVLERLAQTVASEQDPLVFRTVLRAVAEDSTHGAREVAKAALHSPWDDIRLAGIDYVARHRLVEAAAWLLPVIDSPNAGPRRAAVEAAGLCGNPIVLDGTRDAKGDVVYGGLRPLLGTESLDLRREVVLAMARLGDSTGIEELRRSAVDTDPLARLWSIRAMRESGQTRFVTDIVRLLWVERDLRVQQEGLTSLAALVPLDQQPRWSRTATLSEKIAAWSEWDRTRVARP
jgi:hypothetical protein